MEPGNRVLLGSKEMATPALEPAIQTCARRRAFWIWPHLISLDAVAIALLWQQLFSDAAKLSLPLQERSALGLAVWIIYLLDRVLDSTNDGYQCARHRFYRRHRRLAWSAVTIAAIVECFVCRGLAPALVENGASLSAMIALYFLVVHSRWGKKNTIPKEPIVATVFSLGAALTAIHRGVWNWQLSLAALLFALLCLLNCAAIECGEAQRSGDADRATVRKSAAWPARHLSLLALSAGLFATALARTFGARELYTGLAVSALALFWFDRIQTSLSGDQMRVAADIPLLLPALLLMARWHGL